MNEDPEFEPGVCARTVKIGGGAKIAEIPEIVPQRQAVKAVKLTYKAFPAL